MPVPMAIELDGQYRLLREQAGQVDRSERGKLLVSGPEAAEYLQGQLTNDVEALAPGEGQYAALLDRKGRMQADMRVLRLGPEQPDGFWLDTEGLATAAAARHLETYSVGREVAIEDVSGERAIVSVIGPAAEQALAVAQGASVGLAPALPSGPEHGHEERELAGISLRAVRTADGVELICAAADADTLREALAGAGAPEASEAAAEILRVEAGRPRFGAEMTNETIPQEAGINERAVSFAKGCYIGQETVARLHYKGKPNRHLRGLKLSSPATSGDPIRLGEREVGRIGTAVLSPARGPIALAIVRREAEPGDRVAVGEGGAEAEVVEVPFA